MFTRRISRYLRNQDWTAIGIDFVIVVIGVYVGIEVSNWNERRNEARLEVQYLERIQADLASNRKALVDRRLFWKDVAEQARRAVAYAEEGVLAEDSAWKTLLAFFHASHVWRFQINNTTYTEMRSTGDLSLIDSSALRTALAEYFDTRAARRADYYLLFPEYRVTVRSAMPSQVSRYYWDECHTQAAEQQALLDCAAPITEQEALEVLEGLRQTPDLLPQLRFWIDSLGLIIDLADIDIPIIDGLVGRITTYR